MDDSGGFGAPPPPPPPPSEGGGNLGPKTAGEVISSTFTLYGGLWKPLAGLTGIYLAALLVAGIAFFAIVAALFLNDTSTGTATAIAFAVVFVVLYIFAVLLYTGAVTRLAAMGLAGSSTSVGDSINYGMKRAGKIFVVGLLIALIAIGVYVVAILLSLAIKPLTFLFLLAALAGLIVITTLFVAAVPAVVVENVGGTEALSRSADLARPVFWHALGTIALSWLVIVGVEIVVGIFARIPLLGPLMGLAAVFFLLPFASLVFVALYLELRARQEGLTAEALRAQLSA